LIQVVPTSNSPLYEDVTVIVPTYNRPSLLERCLLHFACNKTPFKILVADGSPEDIKRINGSIIERFRKSLNIEHQCYDTRYDFVLRCRDAVKSVNTEFMTFHADDDFISPHGIHAAAKYLKEYSDTVSVQGYSVIFRKEGHYYKAMPYLYRTVAHNTAAERLKQHWHEYRPTFYSTHRTAVMLQALEVSSNFTNFWPRFFEIALSGAVVVQGKLGFVPALYAIRESHDQALSQHDMTWRDMAVHEDHKRHLGTMSYHLAEYISKHDGIEFDSAHKSVHAAYEEYQKTILNPRHKPMPKELIHQSWNVYDLFNSRNFGPGQDHFVQTTNKLMR